MYKKERFIEDLKRIGIALVVVIALSFVDVILPFGSTLAYLTAVLSSTAVVIFIAASSHVTRKIFFPEISVQELIKSSLNHPIASSIAWLGIAIILATLIYANVSLLTIIPQ